MGGYAGIGGSIISSGLGAFAQYREIQAANDAADYNAQGFEMQAQSARTRGAFDLSLLKRDQNQNFGRLEQGLTNSGVSTTGGTAARILAEQRGADVRGQQVQKYNTELDAYGYSQRAAMARSQKQSAWGGALQTLVGGIGQTFSQYEKYRMYTGTQSRGCGLGTSCGYP